MFHSTLTIAAMIQALAGQAKSQVLVHRSHDFRIVRVVDSLENPWSMAFLPNGDILVTERLGRLRVVRKGKLLGEPVRGVPVVRALGQGGLLDVVLHPNFSSNRLIYLSFSKPLTDNAAAATTAVVRGRLENDRLTGVREIFTAVTRGASSNFGSRLAFDQNGYLFITVGDRAVPPDGDPMKHPAQQLSNHHGTINRIRDDGRVPSDNPFVGRPGAMPEIYTKGHRNPQGLVVHPRTGDVWATEHGPQGGDELNVIRSGLNYGWPAIGFGVHYRTGLAIHRSTHQQGLEQPVHVWVPSIGVSAVMIYTGDQFPEWKGSMFVGGLVGEQLVRLSLHGQRAEVAEILMPRHGRIRDVKQGPDGYIYVVIDERHAAAILRLEPISRTYPPRH